MPQTKSYCWENPLFTIGTTLQTKLQLRALYLQKKKKKFTKQKVLAQCRHLWAMQ